MVHNYNPTIQEAKAGRLLVLGQPDLHSKTLSKNMVIFSKLPYKFNTILVKNPAALKRTHKIATIIFLKKNKILGHVLPILKTYYTPRLIKTLYYWYKDIYNWSLEINLYIYVKLNLSINW